MTIKTRNRIIFFVCIMSVVSALAAMTGCFVSLVKLDPQVSNAVRREYSFLNSWAGTAYSVKAAPLSILCLAMLVPFIAGTVFFAFEKTRTKEALFLALFALSCSFESLRFAVPVCDYFGIPFEFAVFSSKMVLFFRILASLSLFASALASSDVVAGESTLFLLVVLAASFLVAGYVPVNSMVRLTTFFYKPGCYGFIRIFTALCGCGSALCYFLSGKTQSIDEYKKSAAGCLVLFLGYELLIHCDCFLFAVSGSLLFVGGVRILLRNLRRFYRWS